MEEGSSLWDRLMYNFSEEDKEQEDVEHEILSLIQEGRERGFFAGGEGELISNIFSYNEKKAEDIMVHRKHIIALDGEKTIQETLKFMLEQKNSRFPVYEEDIDSIIGIFHLRDAVKCYFQKDVQNIPIKNLKEYMHSVSFVPEAKSINKLFKEMKQKKSHMVVVLDEYGQTAGIIAMEDIIEEIVGNIQDEYDDDEECIQKITNGVYLADGMTALEDLEKVLQISFENEDFGTLNGYLVHCLDHIPTEEENCSVEYEGYHFQVVSVSNNLIEKVRIEKSSLVNAGKE